VGKQTKVAVAVVVAIVVGLGSALLIGDGGGADAVDTPEEETALLRDDAHVIGDEGSSDVTFVEFLDFECEACGAAYPVIEELRQKYDGQVTFVARYFPLPGHFNAERAARAVESAARQGEFEAMYQKMFETQASWGEAKTPHDDLFRGFAEELGLDMEQFDRDYASAEVAERVQRDVDDGKALGVESTPTFFLDGERIQPESVQDLQDALDAALAD